MNPQLETSLITAFAAILGTVAGGLSTFATTVYTARYGARRDLMLKNVASREELYSGFITEATSLFIDSLDKSLDKPETLLSALDLQKLPELQGIKFHRHYCMGWWK